ncbi:MAG: class I SAM-dependent methyltransferase [Candidatus Dormibacteria bacterium]
MSEATAVLDLEAVKRRMQAMWSTGFHRVGILTAPQGERLCQAAAISAGDRVLDVACGNGSVALAAARRMCRVTAVDFVPELLEHGRLRAATEHLEIDFIEGDAENLPFPDASFDVVTSQFGAMFAPDQARAASELARVCKPGGTIAMANWTPNSWTGVLFRLTSEFGPPPPPGLRPSTVWGTGPGVRELLGPYCNRITVLDEVMRIRFPSMDQYFDYFASYFGPMVSLRANLDDERWAEYRRRFVSEAEGYNRSTDGAVDLGQEYVIVIGARRGA